MRNLILAIFAVMLLAMATGAKAQTTFEPVNSICSATLEISYCSNVPSADGQYSFDFNGASGSFAVRHNGALVLAASDLQISTTLVDTQYTSFNKGVSKTYRLDGTFSGGTFTMYLVTHQWQGGYHGMATYRQSYVTAGYVAGAGSVELN